MLSPKTLHDAKELVESTAGVGEAGALDVIKEACSMIVSIGNFIKNIITNPHSIIESMQAGATTITLLSLAIIIGLRVLGVKEVEKYGWIILIVYLLLMVL